MHEQNGNMEYMPNYVCKSEDAEEEKIHCQQHVDILL